MHLIFLGPYGNGISETLEDIIESQLNLKGSKGFVVGSQTPWLELLLLKKGAESVTTIDYQKIYSEHPQIQTLTQEELNKSYLKGNLPQYDIFASFSSLEHSGLGR